MGQKLERHKREEEKLWFWLLFLNYFMYICIKRDRYETSINLYF